MLLKSTAIHIRGLFKKPSLYLHIGAEKTGTKSIQSSLTRHADYLRMKHNICYPINSPLFANNSHSPMVSGFVSHDNLDFLAPPNRLSAAQVAAALKYLSQEVQEDSSGLVFSSEYFSSRLSAKQISELQSTLADALPNHRITIVFSVRSQPSLFCSALSTHLRWLGVQWWNAKDVSKSWGYFNHFQTASEWANVFGSRNLNVVNYHQGDAVRQFFKIIGIELPHSEGLRHNASLTLEQCKLMYMINRLFGDPDFNNFDLIQRRYMFTQALMEHVDNLAIEGSPIWSSLSDSDLEYMREEFFQSNQLLTRKFSLDFDLNDYMDKNGDSSTPQKSISNESEALWEAELARWRKVVEEIRRAGLDDDAKLVRLASELIDDEHRTLDKL